MGSSVKIKDTGLYTVGGTMTTGEARAYGDSGIGTELTLKTAEASLGFEVMTSDDSAILKKHNDSDTEYYEFGKSDSQGVQLPTWTIRGYANRTDENDMICLGRLKFMCQTKGIKELISCNDVSFKDIIMYSQYGEREYNGETTKTVSSVYVRIKSFSVSQSADKKGFNYTLNLVETK